MKIEVFEEYKLKRLARHKRNNRLKITLGIILILIVLNKLLPDNWINSMLEYGYIRWQLIEEMLLNYNKLVHDRKIFLLNFDEQPSKASASSSIYMADQQQAINSPVNGHFNLSMNKSVSGLYTVADISFKNQLVNQAERPSENSDTSHKNNDNHNESPVQERELPGEQIPKQPSLGIAKSTKPKKPLTSIWKTPKPKQSRLIGPQAGSTVNDSSSIGENELKLHGPQSVGTEEKQKYVKEP